MKPSKPSTQTTKKTLSIIVLCLAFCGTAFSAIVILLASPQDDHAACRAVLGRSELQSFREECQQLINLRIELLSSSEATNVFGPPIATPTDMVLPIGESSELLLSGALPRGVQSKRHTDLYAIGDIGYLKAFYSLYGTNIENAVLYERADDQFVPLRSEDDFFRRLAWDQTTFARMTNWLNTHLPKCLDFGVVEVSVGITNRMQLGEGKTFLITTTRYPIGIRSNGGTSTTTGYNVLLCSDPLTADKGWRAIGSGTADSLGKRIGFSYYGECFLMTPKVK